MHFPAHPRGQFRLGLRCCSPSVCVVMLSFCGVAARMFYKPRRKRAGKAKEQPHERTRNAPSSNARRARAAREQGLHTIPHTCNLDARVALPTLALLPLVVLRSGSSRCSCCSPRVVRRLQGLRLSSLSRFPFHDSQALYVKSFLTYFSLSLSLCVCALQCQHLMYIR